MNHLKIETVQSKPQEVAVKKSPTALAIESAPLFVDPVTAKRIEELDKVAYDNSIPASDRLQALQTIMHLKVNGFDAAAAREHGANVLYGRDNLSRSQRLGNSALHELANEADDPQLTDHATKSSAESDE